MTLAPCVFCGAAWPYVEAEIDHAASCASLTGLYPVRPVDIKHGMCCTACSTEFAPTDTYVLRRLADHVGEVVCLTCAAFDRVES